MNLQEKIKDVILSKPAPPQGRQIGMEVECLLYDQNFRRIPVNKGDQFSASDLLEDVNDPAKPFFYSLEPGGQLEWASAPVMNLHELKDQFLEHLKHETSLIKEHQLFRLDLSMEPLYSPEKIELIHLEKYHLMHDWFKETGPLGAWMMRNTASIQVNLDLLSEQDGAEMAFLVDVFQPFCSLLFANSPFKNGLPTGRNNFRYQVWMNTDSSRCGYLLDHKISSPEGLLDRYSEWVLTVPAIFGVDQGKFVFFQGTLGDYLASLPQLDDQAILSALHQVFTHVRFKKVLEARGADRPPAGFELASVAFWVGILNEGKTRQKALDLARSFSETERFLFNQRAFTLDLSLKGPRGRTMESWLEGVLELALLGLDERCRKLNIKNERIYLEPYWDLFFRSGFMSLQAQKAYKRQGDSLINYLRRRCEETIDRN